MNIPAHIFAILERLVKILAFAPKGVVSIGKLKNGYHILIAGSQLLLLVADAHYISEAIMLPNTMIDFDQIHKKDFDQKYEKELIRK